MFDREHSNRQKEVIQKRAVELSLQNRHILLSFSTGTGKSKSALECIKAGKPDPKILLLIKETNHEKTWQDEVKKWGLEDIWSNVTVYCYASVKKSLNEYYDWVINDEAHGVSDMRGDYMTNLSFGKMISISATVNQDVKDRLHLICPFTEYHISLSEAITKGILPAPTIHIIYDELDRINKTVEVKTKKVTFKTTPKDHYSYLSAQYKKYKELSEVGNSWASQKALQVASTRKRFVSEQKTRKAREVLEAIKGKRLIFFCGSIEQCNELGGENVVHSKVAKKKREGLFNKLNNKEISNLFAVNMMKESMNIEGIEAGCMLVLNGSDERDFIQSTGRLLRGTSPELYVIVMRGTKDINYLETALANFDKKYVVYHR